MKVKVAQPFRVVHDGVAYGPGDAADVPDMFGQECIGQGRAIEAKARRANGQADAHCANVLEQQCVRAGNLPATDHL